jgi:hypothetical protein
MLMKGENTDTLKSLTRVLRVAEWKASLLFVIQKLSGKRL